MEKKQEYSVVECYGKNPNTGEGWFRIKGDHSSSSSITRGNENQDTISEYSIPKLAIVYEDDAQIAENTTTDKITENTLNKVAKNLNDAKTAFDNCNTLATINI